MTQTTNKNFKASEAAENAARRHERDTEHVTIDLWNDDSTKVEGKCCYYCDWVRFNREPKKK